MPDGAPLVRVLVNFARALRAAGLPVGSGDVLTFCEAMHPLDPTDLQELFWAGRITLVTRHADLEIYDRIFQEFFQNKTEQTQQKPTIHPRTPIQTTLQIPETEPQGNEHDEEAQLGWLASEAETLKHKSFAACTPAELAALRRIMARIRLSPPKRRTRRTKPAPAAGKPDLRRTIRESLRIHGDPTPLRWKRRRVKLRPLILILDISGSMADYSRSLLQFAYSARRAATKVEVFCFGTRLSRITGQLATKTPDEALERAAKVVFDWGGGTRIGESLEIFIQQWGRRGLCRGGIVVICSDGLDRGDPEVLATATARLSRLCHRLIWMNPHKGNSKNFQPSTLGMMVAAPHIDHILSGHDLNSLAELAELLPKLG